MSEPPDLDVLCKQLAAVGGIACLRCRGAREIEIWDDAALNYVMRPCDHCQASGFNAVAQSVLRMWLKKTVIRFAIEIQHGDDVHRRWLTEAATAFGEGKPLPPPRKAAE
jgi:hypothetical protein